MYYLPDYGDFMKLYSFFKKERLFCSIQMGYERLLAAAVFDSRKKYTDSI